SALTAVIANDKACHRILRPNRRRIISFDGVFTQPGSKADIGAPHDNAFDVGSALSKYSADGC
ncbi:hypothetical protein, partial [Bradyrhizobium sp.]|uniref:hypothetical protein n=1 Tax=Bradyrhizobium sp. TaxID=376 RepID=UPI0025C2516D